MLRPVHAHLTQGTRPTRKQAKVTDVKKYLQNVRIGRDGLLVTKTAVPLGSAMERIVVPRHVVDEVVTALHLRLNHPSRYQLNKVFSRTFFALNTDKQVDGVFTNCHACRSLRTAPVTYVPQSTQKRLRV